MSIERGIIYTFYSFKGGVGRSMALANVAALLAKEGKRVLIVDWDLEAPGLEKYFENEPSTLSTSRSSSLGIVDLVNSFSDGKILDWHNCVIYAYPFREGKPVSIITAGRDSESYYSNLQRINWETLFNEQNFGQYLEEVREQWIAEYDFILIDSRTGITDIGGICTIHLPDAIVLLFTANQQNIDGVKSIIDRAAKRHKSLPLDRTKLLGIPVPSRFDTLQEYELANKWKEVFARKFTSIYEDWLPDKTSSFDIVEKLFIPYVPFWSFGEGLPVVSEGTSDPRSIGFAYNILAKLLSSRLQWKSVLNDDIQLSTDTSPEKFNRQFDSLFINLSEYDEEKVKQVLLRLIKFDETDLRNDTVKKVFEKDLNIDEFIIDILIKNNILFKSKDSLTKESVIEFSDSNIVNYWKKLRIWIDENREFLVWRQKLDSKIEDWNKNSRNNNFLLNTVEIVQAEKIINYRYSELNDYEVEFYRISKKNERNKKLQKQIPYFVLVFSFLAITVYFYIQRQEQQKVAIRYELSLRNSDSLQTILIEQSLRINKLLQMVTSYKDTIYMKR